jgi:hypothetical protein
LVVGVFAALGRDGHTLVTEFLPAWVPKRRCRVSSFEAPLNGGRRCKRRKATRLGDCTRCGAFALPPLAFRQARPLGVLHLFELRTTIPLAAEPPARVPQPAARLQRDRGSPGALPLVGVKGFALLRCATACADTTTPVGSFLGSSVELPSGSVRAEPPASWKVSESCAPCGTRHKPRNGVSYVVWCRTSSFWVVTHRKSKNRSDPRPFVSQSNPAC